MQYNTLPTIVSADLQRAVDAVEADSKLNKVIDINDISELEVGYDTSTSQVTINRKGKAVIKPTFHAFGQLCSLAEAPAGFVRQLDDVAAGVLAHRLRTRKGSARFLVHKTEGTLRGIASQTYGRIWSSSILRSLVNQIDTARITSSVIYRPAERDDTYIHLWDSNQHGADYQRGCIIRNSETGGRSASIHVTIRQKKGGVYILHDMFSKKYRHTGHAPTRFSQGLYTAVRSLSRDSVPTELFMAARGKFLAGIWKDVITHAEKITGLVLLELVGASIDLTLTDNDFSVAAAADALAQKAAACIDPDRSFELALAAGMVLESATPKP